MTGSKVDDPIDLDMDSFNRDERRKVQVRFGHGYQALMSFAYRGLTMRPDVAQMVDPNGKPFFPDDVLLFMIWIQRLRTEPDAKETDFDEVEIGDLADRIRSPKAAKKSTKRTQKKT